jgi:hypothetical protein
MESIAGLTLVVTFFVTQGIKGAFALFGKEVSGGVSAFVAVIVGTLVFFFQGLIALLPPATQPTVVAVVGVLATVLGAFGAHKTYKGLAPKP